jgi:hypothetical protein
MSNIDNEAKTQKQLLLLLLLLQKLVYSCTVDEVAHYWMYICNFIVF